MVVFRTQVSPLLANVYLHYVLDLRADWWRRRHARSEVIIEISPACSRSSAATSSLARAMASFCAFARPSGSVAKPWLGWCGGRQ